MLAMKFGWQYKAYEREVGPRWNNCTGNSRRCAGVSVRDSLVKLGAEWIDVLYLHYWD